MKRRTNKTTKKMIVEANFDWLKTLSNLEGLGEKDLVSTCWACGAQKVHVTRSHIVASCHGGKDIPSNYFLLCDVCDEEQPDGASREEQVLWLKKRPDQLSLALRTAKRLVEELVDELGDEQFGKLCRADAFRWVRSWMCQGYKKTAALRLSNARANAFQHVKSKARNYLKYHQ